MKKALILHCWFGKPEDNWYPWVKTELEKKSYEVEVPELPTMNTDKPNLKAMMDTVGSKVDKDMVVIGHSLGALLGMRIAEKQKFKLLVLVSGWDFNDLTKEHASFWEKPFDHQKIIENVNKIGVIHSDDDPYITAFQAEEMAKRLRAKFSLIKGGGHLTAKDGITRLPEILEWIN